MEWKTRASPRLSPTCSQLSGLTCHLQPAGRTLPLEGPPRRLSPPVRLLHLKLGGRSAQPLARATCLKFQLFFRQTVANEPRETDSLNPSCCPTPARIQRREENCWSPRLPAWCPLYRWRNSKCDPVRNAQTVVRWVWVPFLGLPGVDCYIT